MFFADHQIPGDNRVGLYTAYHGERPMQAKNELGGNSEALIPALQHLQLKGGYHRPHFYPGAAAIESVP